MSTAARACRWARATTLARNWQTAPIAITVEGANIMTRSLMIFGQGAIRCHPHVLKEMHAAQIAGLPDAPARFRSSELFATYRLCDLQRGAQLRARPDVREDRQSAPGDKYTRVAITAS